MIIFALIRIAKGQGEGQPPLAQLSGIRNLFGVCVYSFMCQHSLPSLITPISKKKHVNKLVLLDYILILGFYSLLSFTAIYCFRNGTLMDMYTLNFTSVAYISCVCWEASAAMNCRALVSQGIKEKAGFHSSAMLGQAPPFHTSAGAAGQGCRSHCADMRV
ncbi:UNVERIFIED_CONTAM: hypothetical protein K2H54_016226 [Gekko kuhli]